MNRADLVKRSLYFEYITIGWNVAGASVTIGAGIAAGSIALVGFGIDSIIATASAVMLLLRFRLEFKGRKTKDDHTATERKALFVTGVAFFLLALYILNEAGSRFYYKEKPEVSIVGFVLSALFLIIMPPLALRKFRLAKLLENKALRADAMQSAVCACLASVLFLGIGLHAWQGWWWADPLAALIMIPFVVREGWHAIEESKGTAYGAGTAKTGP